MSEGERTIRLVIHGRVQGVGFRHWAVGRARDLDLHGWVRNRRDGAVEAIVRGQRHAVDKMVEACRAGPPSARVDRLDITDIDDDEAVSGVFEQRETIQ